MHNVTASVIIAAAGNSSRMGSDISKQLIKISGKTLIEYSLSAFSKSALVKEIIICAKPEEIDIIKEYIAIYPKISAIVPGGKTRQESVSHALKSVSDNCDIIAIHDAARPLIATEDIDNIIFMASKHGAVCPVSRVTDTVKSAADGIITNTLDRNTLFLASTPQVFNAEIYKKAFNSVSDISVFTDDSSIVESIGQKVHLYIMDKDNTKVTTLKDLDTVRNKLTDTQIRVGHGYDVHKLVPERKLVLGGVCIPHETGLLGHSDADVLIHAIMDALLGAAGLGDIGRHFPDTSEEFKDISSLILLQKVAEELNKRGFTVNNIDATVIAQAPKLSPYINEMINKISKTLEIDSSKVNIKATTEEHLGFTGEKLGISAHAVCTIF